MNPGEDETKRIYKRARFLQSNEISRQDKIKFIKTFRNKFSQFENQLRVRSNADIETSLNKIRGLSFSRLSAFETKRNEIKKYVVNFSYDVERRLYASSEMDIANQLSEGEYKYKYLPIQFEYEFDESYYDETIDISKLSEDEYLFYYTPKDYKIIDDIKKIYNEDMKYAFIEKMKYYQDHYITGDTDSLIKPPPTETTVDHKNKSKTIECRFVDLKHEIVSWLIKILDDEYADRSNPRVTDVLNYKFEVYDISGVKEINIPMYNVSTEKTSVETGLSCVEKFFNETFIESKIKKYSCFSNKKSIYYMTIEKLREIGEAVYNKERNLYGYNVIGIRKICEHYKISFDAYSIDDTLLDSYYVNKNVSLKVCFMVKDNHFYNISANKMKHIKNNNEVYNSFKLNKLRKTFTNVYEDKLNTYNPKIITERNCDYKIEFLEEVDFIKLFNNTNFDDINNDFNIDSETVNCIINNKTKTKYFTKSCENIYKIYQKLNLPVKKKISITNIAFRIMPNMTRIHSEEISLIFKNAPILSKWINKKNNITKIYKYFDSYPTMNYSIDINGHYRNCLDNDFIDFNCSSTIYECFSRFSDTEKLEKLDENITGLFYGKHKLYSNVNHKLYGILDDYSDERGYIWCPFKDDLIDITHYIPGEIINKPFQDSFNKINSIDACYKKHIANMMIGMLNITKQPIYEFYKNTSRIQNLLLVERGFNIGKHNIIFKKDEYDVLRNSNHIRFQIIWYAFKNLEKLMDNYDEIYSIKTDSVYGKIKSDFVMDSKLYKIDKPHSILHKSSLMERELKLKEKKERLNMIKLNNVMLNEINLDLVKNNDTNCFINGKAGYGKTYTLLNLLKHKIDMGKNYVIITNTNVNVNKIRDECNKTFNIKNANVMNFYNFICYYNYKNINKLNYIFIDEMFMMSIECVEALYIAKKLNNNIKFIGNGDYDQNKFHSFWNNFIFSMFDFNQYTLKTNYRNDIDVPLLLNDDSSYGISCFKTTNVIDNNYEHICYFNHTRKRVNKILNELDRNQAGVFKMLLEGEAYLHNSVKLRAVKSNHDLGIFNGDLYLYKDLCCKFKDEEVLNEILKNYIVLGYINTQHVVQGATIFNKYVIHDAEYIFSNKAAKYVSLTRCVHSSNIYVYQA